MVRILHVVSSMNLGGIQSLLMSLYRNIDREVVQFDFVMHTDEECFFSDEIRRLGGKIYVIPKMKINNLTHYINYWRQFFKEHSEYRIVHGHVRTTALIYLSIASANGLTTIAHSHSTYSSKNIVGLIKKILQYPIRYVSDYFFACSQEAAVWLFGKRVANSEKCRLITNAIDLGKYLFSEETRNNTRSSLDIADNMVFGTVGRITIEKNPFFLVDVFEQYCEKVGPAILLWVGDGPLYETVRRYVLQKKCADNVIFVGGTNEIDRYLSAMDVFLFPSIAEGLGIAAIEAQANGLPVIASDGVPPVAVVHPKSKIVPLSCGVTGWVKVLELYNQRVGEGIFGIQELRNAGYDIKIVSRDISEFYVTLWRDK